MSPSAEPPALTLWPASTPGRDTRGQTAVVGVALLLALTVLAVGGLTATAGSIVDDGATTAATTRVGADRARARTRGAGDDGRVDRRHDPRGQPERVAPSG